jgi:hypothetical protein
MRRLFLAPSARLQLEHTAPLAHGQARHIQQLLGTPRGQLLALGVPSSC